MIAALRSAGDGGYEATYPTPQQGDDVSLEVKLSDADGNTAELTTIAAYRFR